ncbi:MAG: glycosyltransferase [Prochlorococcaceae cyanobacterium]
MIYRTSARFELEAVRLLFVCGTLEPAKSGVADFITALARELSTRGVHCACLALHDPFIQAAESPPVLLSTQDGIEIRRIPADLPWNRKAKLFKAQLDDLQPEWISLHYVPYAYNAKGLSFALLSSLFPLRHRAKWEVTAHELWIDPGSSFRNRIISRLQRHILRRLCSRLKPAAVHVTNHCYQAQLGQYGVQASILPLFSSIPLCPLRSSFNRSGFVSQWTFLLFGSINRDWQPEPLFEQIEVARRVHNIQSCRFVSVGQVGDYGATLWDSLQDLPYPAFEFSRLGLLPAERVSEQLQLADFGICVAPSVLVDKSSAVAAMLAHGLPVIISRLSPGCEPWHQQLRRSGHYILLDSSFVERLGAAQKYQPVDQLEDTVHRFVEALCLAP